MEVLSHGSPLFQFLRASESEIQKRVDEMDKVGRFDLRPPPTPSLTRHAESMGSRYFRSRTTKDVQ